MAEVEYPDGSGATITLSNIDGRVLTTGNNREQWEAAREMKTRPEDVFICAYPKSGIHWLWEVVSMIRAQDATPIKELMEFHMLDFAPAEMLLKEDQGTTRRTLTTHKYPRELPKMALEQKCKIVLLLRDPKDCCVSYFHHLRELKPAKYDGTFSGFVQLFLEGKVPFNSYDDYIKEWAEKLKEDNVLVVHYEDMKKNPTEHIERLATFLGEEMSETLLGEIVTNTTFSTMKENKEKLENVMHQFFKSGKEIMYRKGEVGDSDNWLDPTQKQEFQNSIKSKLKAAKCDELELIKRYF